MKLEELSEPSLLLEVQENQFYTKKGVKVLMLNVIQSYSKKKETEK